MSAVAELDTDVEVGNEPARFASALSDTLFALGEQKNLFLSPYSLMVALGMCAKGAKGDTLSAIRNLFNTEFGLKEYIAETIEPNPDYELTSANAAWVQNGFTLKPEYVAALKEFSAGITQVDYKSGVKGPIVNLINDWCSENTKPEADKGNKEVKGKIPEIITEDFINEETRLILTNAIYFKGKWVTEFDKKATRPGPFISSDGKAEDRPLMHAKSEFRYYEDEEIQAVELPYKGENLSMVVVLPKVVDKDLIPESANNLDAGIAYDNAVTGFGYPEDVVLTLPKFKMECEYKLSAAFKAMGAELAFSNDADFSNMSIEERLKISEVIHKSFVEVDEEGTEAAAATAVGMMRCTSVMMPKQPKVFTANRPFLFYIRNVHSNNVLFSGRVNQI